MSDFATMATSTQVTLADCCEEIGQRVDNPAKSGYERFVGLEHLESGETSIRSWGSTEDVTSSMKLFKAGDVIVARRNVYLRRAARADFDGVCSGDGIVLRPSGKACLPDLLPFLLNTETFWDYVSSQADGTMSKRITVKRLMEYEFALPPLEEQRRIVEVLQGVATTIESLLKLTHNLSEMRNSAIDSLTFGLDAEACSVGEHCAMQNGRPFPGNEYCDDGELLLRPGNLAPSGYLSWDIDKTKRVPARYREEASDFIVNPGDILINLTAQSLEDGFMGRVCIAREGDESLLNQRIGRFTDFSEHLLPEFLFRVLQSAKFKRHAITMCEGSKIQHLFWEHISRFELPLPPIEEQSRVIDALRSIDSGVDDTTSRLKATRELKNRLLSSALDNKARRDE